MLAMRNQYPMVKQQNKRKKCCLQARCECDESDDSKACPYDNYGYGNSDGNKANIVNYN